MVIHSLSNPHPLVVIHSISNLNPLVVIHSLSNLHPLVVIHSISNLHPLVVIHSLSNPHPLVVIHSISNLHPLVVIHSLSNLHPLVVIHSLSNPHPLVVIHNPYILLPLHYLLFLRRYQTITMVATRSATPRTAPRAIRSDFRDDADFDSSELRPEASGGTEVISVWSIKATLCPSSCWISGATSPSNWPRLS